MLGRCVALAAQRERPAELDKPSRIKFMPCKRLVASPEARFARTFRMLLRARLHLVQNGPGGRRGSTLIAVRERLSRPSVSRGPTSSRDPTPSKLGIYHPDVILRPTRPPTAPLADTVHSAILPDCNPRRLPFSALHEGTVHSNCPPGRCPRPFRAIRSELCHQEIISDVRQ
jgi:hypothetical protein